MDAVADLADKYSFGELRISHEQNIILADVKKSDLYRVYEAAKEQGLATANTGLLTGIICCPGGDFCDLANAKSIPIANAIQARFDDIDYLFDIGELDLNISGCMNACGHTTSATLACSGSTRMILSSIRSPSAAVRATKPSSAR
jgi:sulfite reductase (NADPH) hemoprotein beta-component